MLAAVIEEPVGANSSDQGAAPQLSLENKINPPLCQLSLRCFSFFFFLIKRSVERDQSALKPSSISPDGSPIKHSRPHWSLSSGEWAARSPAADS